MDKLAIYRAGHDCAAIFTERLEAVRAQSSLPGIAERLMDLLQAIAINHKATIIDMARLLDKLAPDLPGVDRDEIRRQILIPATSSALHEHRHVAMFIGRDSRVRLVDGSVPASRAEAKAFMAASAQVPGVVCAFCLLDDEPELRSLGRRWIHPHCHGFYLTWYRAAIRQRFKKAGWETLGLPGPNESKKTIEKAFKRKAMQAHPDREGGSDAAMAELNAARTDALNSQAAKTS